MMLTPWISAEPLASTWNHLKPYSYGKHGFDSNLNVKSLEEKKFHSRCFKYDSSGKNKIYKIWKWPKIIFEFLAFWLFLKSFHIFQALNFQSFLSPNNFCSLKFKKVVQGRLKLHFQGKFIWNYFHKKLSEIDLKLKFTFKSYFKISKFKNALQGSNFNTSLLEKPFSRYYSFRPLKTVINRSLT